MSESTLRGYKGIKEVADKARSLASFYKQFKPGATLVLARPDFDLVKRWPKAAHAAGFDVTDRGVFFDGLQCAHDRKPSRYEARA